MQLGSKSLALQLTLCKLQPPSLGALRLIGRMLYGELVS
jgi:hypothetical protein